MSKSVLCAGRLYCDLIFSGASKLPSPGTEVFADGLTMHAGGGAFITAATLASLGHSTALLSVLPRDPFGTLVMQDLLRFNVSPAMCRKAADAADPQITVAIPFADDRAFLTRMDGPAVPVYDAAELEKFDHLHVGELRTLQENPGLIGAAKTAGLTISVDCSWQDEFAVTVGDIIENVDIFLPSACEETALMAVGVPDNCAPLSVVKCGPDGARARMRDDAQWIHAATGPATVIDTTGAGDAFNGGFLSGWLRGASVSRCLELGNNMGHASVQAVGGTGGLRAKATT